MPTFYSLLMKKALFHNISVFHEKLRRVPNNKIHFMLHLIKMQHFNAIGINSRDSENKSKKIIITNCYISNYITEKEPKNLTILFLSYFLRLFRIEELNIYFFILVIDNILYFLIISYFWCSYFYCTRFTYTIN